MPEVTEGFVSLVDGMQGGVEPMLTKETSFSVGVNVTGRRGLLQTRPSFRKVADIPSGLYQGAGRWSLNGGDRIVLSLGGVIYYIDCDTYSISSVPTEILSPIVSKCYFNQIDRWFMIQDGAGRPVVLEEDDSGSVVLFGRDDPKVSYVVGTVGCYAHGRFHYSPIYVPTLTPDPETLPTAVPVASEEPGRMGFVSSDVMDLLNPEYVFRMSEHRVVAEGGEMSMPQELGFVTAMAALRNADTGTGVGALVVFARNGVSAFDVSITRAQWKTTQISQVLFTGASTQSPWSVCSVNGDLFYIDDEGHVRTLRYSTSEVKNALTSLPLSNELVPYVMKNNLSIASTAFVDNRLLATFCGHDTLSHFRALASLDLAVLQARGASPQSMYDGLWTGFKFKQVLSAFSGGVTTLFAIVEKDDGAHALMVLDDDDVYDEGSVPIESQIVTRTFLFKSPTDQKLLKYVELWLADIQSNTTVSVYVRPSGYPYWQLVGTKALIVPDGTPAQVRRGLRFSVDFNAAKEDTVNNEKLTMGSGLQFLIKWRGRMKIETFRATASVDIVAPPACEEDNPESEEYEVVPGSVEEFDPFEYEVPL